MYNSYFYDQRNKSYGVLHGREGSGGVAGGRGHPDLTGSAKPGLSDCGIPRPPPAPGGRSRAPPGGQPVRPTSKNAHYKFPSKMSSRDTPKN